MKHGNLDVLGEAFLTAVIALGDKIGYRNQNQIYQEYQPSEEKIFGDNNTIIFSGLLVSFYILA